jgi:hypothetical protein
MCKLQSIKTNGKITTTKKTAKLLDKAGPQEI